MSDDIPSPAARERKTFKIWIAVDPDGDFTLAGDGSRGVEDIHEAAADDSLISGYSVTCIEATIFVPSGDYPVAARIDVPEPTCPEATVEIVEVSNV